MPPAAGTPGRIHKKGALRNTKKPVIPSQCAHWRGNPYPFFRENGLPRLLMEPRNDKHGFFAARRLHVRFYLLSGSLMSFQPETSHWPCSL